MSRSITAASHWNDRRRLYWDLVGCDEGCTTPRERHSASVPTRYDMWLGPEDIAQPERHNEGHCRICLRGDGQHVMGPGRARPTPGAIAVTTSDGRRQMLPTDEPIIVSKGMIVEVGMDETRVWSALGRLLIDPTGGPEDPLDWSDAPSHWQTTDADLRSRCKGSHFAQRWVAIGPLRVTGVRADQRVLPLVFDLRRPGSGLLLQRTWVRAGAYRIGEVGTWRLSAYDGQESRIKVLDDRQCVLDTTVDWVMSEGLEALMALALEPYDPTGCEVLFDRRRHLALRDAVITDAVFNVETDDLRCRLDASSDYRRVRAALQHPSSDPDFFEQLQACVKEPDKSFRPL